MTSNNGLSACLSSVHLCVVCAHMIFGSESFVYKRMVKQWLQLMDNTHNLIKW